MTRLFDESINRPLRLRELRFQKKEWKKQNLERVLFRPSKTTSEIPAQFSMEIKPSVPELKIQPLASGKSFKNKFLGSAIGFLLLLNTLNSVIPIAEAAVPKSNSLNYKPRSKKSPDFDQEVPPQIARTSGPIPTQTELDKRVTLSDGSEKWYKNHAPSIREKDIKILKIALKQLTKDSIVRCKLQSAFERDLKFSIFSDEELGKIYPLYNPPTNTIRIPLTALKSASLISMLRHEIHHAFIRFQNTKTGRLFFDNEGRQWHHYSIPCEVSQTKSGNADCYDINLIQKQGFEKVDSLLDLWDKKDAKRENELFTKYLKLSQAYIPLAFESEVTTEVVKDLQSQGLLTKDLKILDPPGILISETSGVTNYIFSIELINGHYLAQSRRYFDITKTHPGKIALLDLKFLCLSYKNMDFANKVKEQDAVIHQVLEPYPKLYDLLFPGLREYHQKRSDTNYQQCVSTKSIEP